MIYIFPYEGDKGLENLKYRENPKKLDTTKKMLLD